MTDVAGERPGLVREASECPVKDVGFDTEGFKRGEDRKRVTGQCGGEWMEAGRQEAETSEEVVELTGLEETLSETREMRSIPLSRFFLFSFQCFLGHYYTQLFYNLTVLICLFWKSLPTLFLGPEIDLPTFKHVSILFYGRENQKLEISVVTALHVTFFIFIFV